MNTAESNMSSNISMQTTCIDAVVYIIKGAVVVTPVIYLNYRESEDVLVRDVSIK
jgi:hypothetical protein